MQNDSLQQIIANLKDELADKTRQLEDANARAAHLQNLLDQNVNETSSNEVNFAESWKENKILRRVIAKETEEVHSVYEKCVTIIHKYQQLEAQYKEVLSILLNSEPATASQELLSKLQKENEEQRIAIETLTTKFTNKKNKYHALKGQYKQVKDELEQLKSSDPEINDKAQLLEEIAQLKDKLQSKNSEVNELTKTVSDLNTKLAIGKFGNDEVPQKIDDFINQPITEELEAKYEADKEQRDTKIQSSENASPINISEKPLLLRIAELEAQLNELKEKTGYDLVTNEDGKPWSFVPREGRLQERGGINPLTIQNREEEDEVDPQDLPSVDVSIINSPKPEERPNLASHSEDEDVAELDAEENELDSEYEALLRNENVANKELITKLMNEVKKLRKELRKDKQERRELVESLRQSGSILSSAPHSPKGKYLEHSYQPNEVDKQYGESVHTVPREAPIIEEEEEELEQQQDQEQPNEQQEQQNEQEEQQNEQEEQQNEHEEQQNEQEEQPDEQQEQQSEHFSDHREEENLHSNESKEDGDNDHIVVVDRSVNININPKNGHEEEDIDDSAEEIQKLTTLLNQPPPEDLEEANSRIKQLEDEIKHLCDKINNLQFQETQNQSTLNASSIAGNDNSITHDFKNALKRIAKLQKKLDDHTKPPENMQYFEDEISRLRTELDESSKHAKELQELLDSFSQTTNNGVIEVVKENQNMKKTIERKDKEIEDATRKGADILTKYNEQQNTIKTLINELKAAKTRINELTKANSEFSLQVDQLQQDLDQADADAEGCKDDLAQLDEITGKYFLAQTELDTAKIKLEKSMTLLKTKGGQRAIYALEMYDNIVDYQSEIAGQKELLKNIESVLGLPQDSLLGLVDKESQPKPNLESTENQDEEEGRNDENLNENENENEENEERKRNNLAALRKLLADSKVQIDYGQPLLYESGNDFFNECDKLTDENSQLKKETERMRTILAHIEEELHLEPGHLTNRQVEDETEENEEGQRKLPSGWLNQIVSENNGGNGLVVQTRGARLNFEEEEEEIEKAREIERLNAETCNHQTKITHLESTIDLLQKQIISLNNQLSIVDTGRLAALQTNNVLTDKCAELQRKLTQLSNVKNNNINGNISNALIEFENDYLLAKEKAEESEEKIRKLKKELGKAKAELQNAEDNKKQIDQLTQTVRDLSKEKTELQKKIAELEILNA